jgi:hypothetical protein
VACDGRSFRATRLGSSEGIPALVIVDGPGRPAGVALIEPVVADWAPFLSASISGRQMTLSRGDRTIACALTTALAGVEDSGLRSRAEALDALVVRAMADVAAGRLGRDAYATLVRRLWNQELLVHAEAGLRTFPDRLTDNYWHRSRLKFPTLAAQAVEEIAETLPR